MLARWTKRLVAPPRRRLLRAEQAFFDAHCRGGTRPPPDLVIPLDYFANVRVARTFQAWMEGESDLDVDALLAAWRAATGRSDEARFFRNLACFLAYLHAPRNAGAGAASAAGRAGGAR